MHVNVIDADDQNPKFHDERYSAIVPDRASQVILSILFLTIQKHITLL